jgi:hypothetical protein
VNIDFFMESFLGYSHTYKLKIKDEDLIFTIAVMCFLLLYKR